MIMIVNFIFCLQCIFLHDVSKEVTHTLNGRGCVHINKNSNNNKLLQINLF